MHLTPDVRAEFMFIAILCAVLTIGLPIIILAADALRPKR
jgi:hypothetical protein